MLAWRRPSTDRKSVQLSYVGNPQFLLSDQLDNVQRHKRVLLSWHDPAVSDHGVVELALVLRVLGNFLSRQLRSVQRSLHMSMSLRKDGLNGKIIIIKMEEILFDLNVICTAKI